MSFSGHPTFILFLCTSTDYIHIYKANLLTYELDYLSFCFQVIVTRLRIVLPVLRSSIGLFGMYFEYFEQSISFLYLQDTYTIYAYLILNTFSKFKLADSSHMAIEK